MDPIQGYAPGDQLLSVQPPPSREDQATRPEESETRPMKEADKGEKLDTYA